MSGRLLFCALAMLLAWRVAAAENTEKVVVCFNYGCLAQAEVVFSQAQLREVAGLLGEARDAAQERERIGIAIGRLLGWAGEQSPIAADRGGNYADDAVYGKMDCIDHSTTTTRLLQMLERRQLLRFHRVLEPQLRRRFLVFLHYSAQIEEIAELAVSDPAGAAPGAQGAGRYAVDSWFFDNGKPAAVMPLAQWQSGESPNDAL